MSQHDYILADAAGAAFRADANNALAAIVSRNSGATAPATTYAYMLWADTTAGVLKRRNAANSAWIIESTLDEAFVLSRASNTILDESDYAKTIRATGGYTQTFSAASTLGDGWWVGFRVEAGVTLTLDPNASETIDGNTTISVLGPATGMILCNGSAFYTIGAVIPATQAEQEAGSSLAVVVTSGRQHFHPSAAKAWVKGNSGGSILASYNIASITDNGLGAATVNIATDFSSANYAVSAGFETGGGMVTGCIRTITAGSFDWYTSANGGDTAADVVSYHFSCFGDQA